MADLPAGTVTFLFTDIEGSTDLLNRLRDRYATLLAEQRRILRAAFDNWDGQEVDTQGDAFFVSFPRARDAIEAAVEIQGALAEHSWPESVQVRVRMGLHTGEPLVADGGYVGMDVHRAARIAHAGHGGQVLLSETTTALVRDELPAGIGLKDLGEYRLKGFKRPEHIYQLSMPGSPVDFPPLSAQATARHNLPYHQSAFIGREREIDQVVESLERERLVTLFGAGGVGKTRLSIEVAFEMLRSNPDGVWLVELAPISDPDLVVQTVAQTWEVREEAGRPLLTTLREFLRSRRMLIVLDNCEHLIDASAHVASEILETCPRVSILASSREALGVAGEVPYPMPTMAVADPDKLPDISELVQVEAIRLFQARARTVNAGFTITEQNASAVAQICKRLDGIPLAIELAAARTRVLAAQQIATRLDDRFQLLTGGSRTALPRHQTLRATIDWSYQLLSKPERTLFRRLSVFVGGWTLKAAEAVCAEDEDEQPGAGLQPTAVLDVLMQLVDKSLVLKSDIDGIVRYHGLETVRQYALEKIMESAEADGLHRRHLIWFLRLAEEAEARLDGPEQLEWLGQLETEHDNLRAALEWSQRAATRTEIGLRLAGALAAFWRTRGYLSEGRARLSAVLKLQESESSSLAHAKALAGAAGLAYRQSDYPATRNLYEQSLQIYRELGPEGRHGMAIALIGLGNVATEVGDYEAAPALFEQALLIMRERQHTGGIAEALRNLGWCSLRPGDYAQAKLYLEEALTLFRSIEDERGIASTLSGLGEVAVRQVDYGTADRLLAESLELRRELGNKWGIAASLGSIGWVALLQGDLLRTRALLEESLEIRNEIGDIGGIAWCLERLAEAAGAESQVERQVRIFGAAAALRASIDSVIDPVDQPQYQKTLARALQKLGRPAFNAAWDEGALMDSDQAIRLALETHPKEYNSSQD